MANSSVPHGTQPLVVFTSGLHARKLKRQDGQRTFLPFRVTIEASLSELSVTSETLVFYLYQESAEQAISKAGYMMRKWRVGQNGLAKGYPKPTGHGTAKRIDDREFDLEWRQAESRGYIVHKAGRQDDPVGYHIVAPSGIITFG